MPTNEAQTCEQRGLKTYQVLDAMLAGATRIPLIVEATGLSYRTVNALVYALEKQGRVLARSYDVRRCNQVFDVLRYDAYPASQKSRLFEHPAYALAQTKVLKQQKLVNDRFQTLHQAFFFSQTATQPTAWA